MMDKKLLPKDFFRKNPLDKISSAMIADFSLKTLFDDGLNTEMEKILSSSLSDDRKTTIPADRAEIEHLSDGEAVVAYMRKNHDNVADPMFCRKALTLEAEAAPLIVQRFKTSGQDRFIELAFRILAKSDNYYAEQLFAEYREIRNPYAQAMACLLFGEKGMEPTVPLLLKEYDRFKRDW